MSFCIGDEKLLQKYKAIWTINHGFRFQDSLCHDFTMGNVVS